MKSFNCHSVRWFALAASLLLNAGSSLAQSGAESVEEALRFAQVGNYQEALPLFRDGYSTVQADPNLEYAYASCLEQNGEDDAAVIEFQHVDSLFAGPFFGAANSRLLSSRALYRIGRIMQRKGDFGRALSEYERATANDPANGYAYNSAGSIYLDNVVDYDKAVANFQMALRYLPNSAAPKENLYKAYTRMGVDRAKADDLDHAIDAFEQALRYAPNDATDKSNLGICYARRARRRSADLDGAIADFKAAIRVDPARAEEYVKELGQRYLDRGRSNEATDIDGAIIDYTTAIFLDPSADAYWYRGSALTRDHNPDGALADLNEAIRRDPTKDSYYASRAFLKESQLDWDAAIADYTEAIRINHRSGKRRANCYFRRGGAWQAKLDFDAAISDYTEAIKISPRASQPPHRKGKSTSENATVYLHRAEARFLKGDLDGSITDCSEELKLEPDSARAFQLRGDTRRKRGESSAAVADYAEAIRLEPNIASHYIEAAWLLATSDDPSVRNGAQAVEYATKACELTQWNEAAFLDALAAGDAEVSDFENAVKWETVALDKKPSAAKEKLYRQRLALYRDKKPYREAKSRQTAAGSPGNMHLQAKTDTIAAAQTGPAESAPVPLAEKPPAEQRSPAEEKAQEQYQAGKKFDEDGDSDKAIVAYGEAVRLSPTNAEYQTALGESLDAKGDSANAIAAFREAVRLQPANGQYRFRLGQAYHYDSNWSAAIASYREAIRLDPKNSQCLRKLGYVLVKNGDFGEAVSAYEQAIALGDNDAWTIEGYGEALAGAGRSQEAMNQMEAAVKKWPDNDLIRAQRDKLAAKIQSP